MPTILLYAALTLLLIAILAIALVIRRAGRLRREFDDQGIKLIQTTNQCHELKKRLVKLESTVDTLTDWLERTNVRLTPLTPSADLADAGVSGRDIDPTLPLADPPTAPLDEMDEPLLAEYTDDEPATNVRFLNPDTDSTTLDFAAERLARQDKLKKAPKSDESVGDKPQAKQLRLKRRFADFQEFADIFQDNLTKVGLFYPSKRLIPVGTRVDLDLLLVDGSPLICGKGEIKRNHREGGGANQDKRGMDVRFIYLDQVSKEMIRRVLTISS